MVLVVVARLVQVQVVAQLILQMFLDLQLLATRVELGPKGPAVVEVVVQVQSENLLAPEVMA